MTNGFVVANFRHVADGAQEGQFAVGDKRKAASLYDLAPIYRQLLDEPVTVTLAVTGPDGRPSLTPMWFDHADGEVLVNTASHRNKCQWIRDNPRLSLLLVNPKNPVPLDADQVHGAAGVAGVGRGGRLRHATNRSDLDEVYRAARALWFARSKDR